MVCTARWIISEQYSVEGVLERAKKAKKNVWFARYKLNGWIPFTLALKKKLGFFTLDNLYLSTILERACALFWVDWLTWLHAEGRSQKKNVWFARYKLNGWIPFTLALKKKLGFFTLDNLDLSIILERACALFWVEWLNCFHAEGRGPKKNVWLARFKLNGWIPFTLALQKNLWSFTLDNLYLSTILE